MSQALGVLSQNESELNNKNSENKNRREDEVVIFEDYNSGQKVGPDIVTLYQKV